MWGSCRRSFRGDLGDGSPGGLEAPAAIDYLGLVARRHQEELARAINYSDLAAPDVPDEPDKNELVTREADDDGEAVAR